jgi:hypothetical protein
MGTYTKTYTDNLNLIEIELIELNWALHFNMTGLIDCQLKNLIILIIWRTLLKVQNQV